MPPNSSAVTSELLRFPEAAPPAAGGLFGNTEALGDGPRDLVELIFERLDLLQAQLGGLTEGRRLSADLLGVGAGAPDDLLRLSRVTIRGNHENELNVWSSF